MSDWDANVAQYAGSNEEGRASLTETCEFFEHSIKEDATYHGTVSGRDCCHWFMPYSCAGIFAANIRTEGGWGRLPNFCAD